MARATDQMLMEMRKLTPLQRELLHAVPKHGYSLYATAQALKIHSSTVHRWVHNSEEFQKARQAIEDMAIDEVGVTHSYVLRKTVEVVERCMQAEPVLDHEGMPTGEYQFKEAGALKGLDMLGKYRRLWGEDRPAAQQPVGPGLTVIVQQAVKLEPGQQGKGYVEITLPGPG
jgi:transposase-like protein